MTHTVTYLGFIPLLPLAGALVVGLIYLATCQGKQISERIYGVLGCVGPVLSFFVTVKVFFALLSLPAEERFLTHKAFTWFAVGDLDVSMGFLADPLSSLMLLFVTFVGSLIHIYSIGYMAGDPGFSRYYAFMSLFAWAMMR